MKTLKSIKMNLVDFRQRFKSARLTKGAAFWIVLGAIILTVYFGFSKAGWVTGESATNMAVKTSKDAVTQRLASICVAQANQDPLKGEKLEELNGLATTTNRTNFVKEQAWATMPGETTPDSGVVSECARQLALLDH
jgi:hypothetical protein